MLTFQQFESVFEKIIVFLKPSRYFFPVFFSSFIKGDAIPPKPCSAQLLSTFLCRTLSVRVQKEHPLRVQNKSIVQMCAHSQLFPLLLQKQDWVRAQSNPLRQSVYTEKLSTRTHVRTCARTICCCSLVRFHGHIHLFSKVCSTVWHCATHRWNRTLRSTILFSLNFSFNKICLFIIDFIFIINNFLVTIYFHLNSQFTILHYISFNIFFNSSSQQWGDQCRVARELIIHHDNYDGRERIRTLDLPTSRLRDQRLIHCTTTAPF